MDYTNGRFKPTLDYAVDIIKRNLGDKIQEIWVFGSCAKGTAKLTSDMDIMVSLKDNSMTRSVRFDLYDHLQELPVKVDLHFCINGSVNSYSEIFSKEVENTKVVIYNGCN